MAPVIELILVRLRRKILLILINRNDASVNIIVLQRQSKVCEKVL